MSKSHESLLSPKRATRITINALIPRNKSI